MAEVNAEEGGFGLKEDAFVIDVRARPSTAEYLSDYLGTDAEGVWRSLGRRPPKVTTMDEYLHDLDRAQVTLSVFTGRQLYREAERVLGVSNDYVAKVARESDGRIVGVASVDPFHDADAGVEELNRCFDELGLRGLSLDPALWGISPDDSILDAALEVAEEYDVPAIFTMGPLAGPLCNPSAVDRVATRHPSLKILCSHGCWPQTLEFIALAYRHHNVWLEASLYHSMPGAQPFIDAANGMLKSRVVYGSAFPFGPLTAWRDLARLGITDAASQHILWQNAVELFGLGEQFGTEVTG